MWETLHANEKAFNKAYEALSTDEQLIVANWLAAIPLSGPFQAATDLELKVAKLKGTGNKIQWELKITGKKAGQGKPNRVSFTIDDDGKKVTIQDIGHA